DEWISPAAFIPVLEELRHIIELTRKATDTAIKDLQQWYAEGYIGYVSINLSALHFKTHFDLDYIEERLAEAGLPRTALRFEITEGVLIDKSDEVLLELKRIRDAGFKLALDDFGTGYSSLSY
ncbi:MAG TPA: diguanylate cyclase, partial [Alteromonas sp.]|nr:diguanylate cyclase [Alteromonas sp.]